MNILNSLKTLEQGFITVPINSEVQDAFKLILNQRSNLIASLTSAIDNEYGFFDEGDILDIIDEIERVDDKRRILIDAIGIKLLGMDYRSILNSFGVEFQVVLDGPPGVVFFRPEYNQ